MKVTVVGAGNVGATCANVLAHRDFLQEVVLLDIKEGTAEGKALDTWQQAPIDYYSTKVTGVTNDYTKTADSDVVVITSGLPRKPGMSRDDLISTNANIVKSVTENVTKYSPNAIIISCVQPAGRNDLLRLPHCQKRQQQGIRHGRHPGYRALPRILADEIGCSPKDIQAILMGGHGDTMVPLPRYTTVSGIPVTELVAADKLDAIIQRTKVGGGEIVNLLGTSAWYAPGAAAAQMVEAIVKDEKRIFPVCA